MRCRKKRDKYGFIHFNDKFEDGISSYKYTGHSRSKHNDTNTWYGCAYFEKEEIPSYEYKAVNYLVRVHSSLYTQTDSSRVYITLPNARFIQNLIIGLDIVLKDLGELNYPVKTKPWIINVNPVRTLYEDEKATMFKSWNINDIEFSVEKQKGLA